MITLLDFCTSLHASLVHLPYGFHFMDISQFVHLSSSWRTFELLHFGLSKLPDLLLYAFLMLSLELCKSWNAGNTVNIVPHEQYYSVFESSCGILNLWSAVYSSSSCRNKDVAHWYVLCPGSIYSTQTGKKIVSTILFLRAFSIATFLVCISTILVTIKWYLIIHLYYINNNL